MSVLRQNKKVLNQELNKNQYPLVLTNNLNLTSTIKRLEYSS